MSTIATSRPSTRCSRSVAFRPGELGPPAGHLVAVLQVDREQLAQGQGAGLTLDQRHRVDREVVLHLGQPVELVEQRVGIEPVLHLDHQAGAVGPVRQVLHVGDALHLAAGHQVLDLLDHPFRTHQVGQFGDHDALTPGVHLLDPGGGPDPERALAGVVRVADAVQADDLAAGGQIGTGNEPHQLLDLGVGVLDQVPERLHHLDQVVRRAVGGHPDGDAAGPVDQQVRKGGRQHHRLGVLAVVVRLEVDGVLVQPVGHRRRGRGHPALGVAHGRRPVVQRAEVSVPVDQGQPHAPGLGGADQGVIDRGVAVRVVDAHHLTDHPGALDVRVVGADAHLVHPVEDAALDRLQPVPGVRQRPGVDDRVRVLEKAGLHLRGHVDVDDPLDEVVLGGCRRSGHLPPSTRVALPSLCPARVFWPVNLTV